MEPHTSENPICISLLICDDVYRDDRTGKQVIVGTFNSITCQSLPNRHQRLYVVFSITDTRSTIDLSLSIEHEESGQSLVTVQGPYHAVDPLTIHDINVELNGIEFQQPGKHWVMLKSNGEIISQRPFWVYTPDVPRAEREETS